MCGPSAYAKVCTALNFFPSLHYLQNLSIYIICKYIYLSIHTRARASAWIYKWMCVCVCLYAFVWIDTEIRFYRKKNFVGICQCIRHITGLHHEDRKALSVVIIILIIRIMVNGIPPPPKKKNPNIYDLFLNINPPQFPRDGGKVYIVVWPDKMIIFHKQK